MLGQNFALFLLFVAVAQAGTVQYRWLDKVGSCKLHYIPAGWQEARLRCEYEGGEMASPMEPSLLTPLMKAFGRERVFLGIHTAYTGEYYSIDGVPLDSISVEWAPNEPNNFGDNENCLALNSNGTVADVKCSHPLPFICCKDTDKAMRDQRLVYNVDNEVIEPVHLIKTTESPMDSTSVELTTNWPNNLNSENLVTDVITPLDHNETSTESPWDSNQGILAEWHTYGPNFEYSDYPDTDVLHPLHLNNETAEEVKEIRSDGYTCQKSLGSCYKYRPVEATWSEAANACAEESAQLVVVNSQQEATFLKDMAYGTGQLYPYLYYTYFVGFRATMDDPRKWLTIDGQPLEELDYLAWSYDHPDNMTKFSDYGEYCAKIVIHDNGCYFQSHSCDSRMFCICEKKMDVMSDKHDVDVMSETPDEDVMSDKHDVGVMTETPDEVVMSDKNDVDVMTETPDELVMSDKNDVDVMSNKINLNYYDMYNEK